MERLCGWRCDELGSCYDPNWQRDIGYGVPALCDHPECSKKIDRGLSYVCGGGPFGGEEGCGLYFCGEHLLCGPYSPARCEGCSDNREPFDPKPDLQEWTDHKMTDPSWAQWRINEGIERTPTTKNEH